MAVVEVTKDVFRLGPLQETRTLTKLAYAAIKEAILSLEFKPGRPLVEDELAAQLGISKTPVRDALLELERDGLVVRIPYKGTYVSEVSEQDAREILELRAVLEGLAGRLAATSFTPEEVDRAEAILDAYDQALAAGELAEASARGEAFHVLIFKRASNQRLLTILNTLEEQLRRLRLISNRGVGRLEKSAVEHRKILAALRQGQPDLVEAALRDHHLSVLRDLSLSNQNSH